jgi:hypothetical protein
LRRKQQYDHHSRSTNPSRSSNASCGITSQSGWFQSSDGRSSQTSSLTALEKFLLPGILTSSTQNSMEVKTMVMGRRKAKQQELFVATTHLARSPGHPFYEKLNKLLAEAGFDAWLEAKCEPY